MNAVITGKSGVRTTVYNLKKIKIFNETSEKFIELTPKDFLSFDYHHLNGNIVFVGKTFLLANISNVESIVLLNT